MPVIAVAIVACSIQLNTVRAGGSTSDEQGARNSYSFVVGLGIRTPRLYPLMSQDSESAPLVPRQTPATTKAPPSLFVRTEHEPEPALPPASGASCASVYY